MTVTRRGVAAGLILVSLVPAARAQGTLPTRTSDDGGVRVVVKPKTIDGATWEFEVTMDTHSKPLDDDLTKTAFLVDGDGGRSAPVAWQGDAPGAHHRKGVLRFTAPAKANTFELQMAGPGGTAQRAFKWTR